MSWRSMDGPNATELSEAPSAQEAPNMRGRATPCPPHWLYTASGNCQDDMMSGAGVLPVMLEPVLLKLLFP